MIPAISEKSLVNLLETNNWFRAGTPKQYIKLLEANANGSSLDTLTGIIWTCSDDVSREDVHDKLQELEQKELDDFVRNLYLCNERFDADMLIDDPYICYETV